MRIESLAIENFRAIANLELPQLSNAIVLAGPNGCGKSSVLDAIRLLKSAYGQYHQNEYQQWFQEFQISFQHMSREAHRVLQDPNRPLLLRAGVQLSESEKAFLSDHGKDLTEQLTWTRITPPSMLPPGLSGVVAPTDRRVHGESARRASREMLESLPKELDQPVLVAELQMQPTGEVSVRQSSALELVFSNYAPQSIGVIDYHGANRNYAREQVASVNLNVDAGADRFRQSALYNTSNKYTNIKTEMASAYVHELLAQAAGVAKPPASNLMATLQELFEVFVPGKRFRGPEPTRDGKLRFNVELTNGLQHDIDELSAGEKEVLLGYLRLRNSAPHDSVILLDEPELHLNPRLIRGLPRFYQKHLGDALNNQIWMITHSDTLLREAVEESAFTVFHMQALGAVVTGENQAHVISGAEHVERAVMDLVGDLATYTPKGRIVLLEGGGDAEVDLNILRQLFPDFSERVNLVSAGSKSRVRELHALLEQAAADGRFRARFFSIVDRDFDGPSVGSAENRFSWDVYHIENYLLSSRHIEMVLQGLEIGPIRLSVDDIDDSLREAARETIRDLVRLRMERRVNHELISEINTGSDPKATSLAVELDAAIRRSVDRLSEAARTRLTLPALQAEERSLRGALERDLSDGVWQTSFRGRDILRRFVARERLGIPYEQFRNLIINRMRLEGYRPHGIARIVDAIMGS